jgi:hypothetical protein
VPVEGGEPGGRRPGSRRRRSPNRRLEKLQKSFNRCGRGRAFL